MKIVSANQINSVSDYALVEAPQPIPGPDDVLIRVYACGMGYVDALVALGKYQVKPTPPFTPGHEIGGVVVQTGANVTSLAVGDRVMAKAFGGGLAEYVTAAANTVRRIPAAMSFAQAAALSINYLTALHGLKDRAALKAGERLLILGAAGGVGLAAVQVGMLLGAEIIAAASTEEKRAYLRSCGLKHVLDTDPNGWRDRLRSLSDGRGPDVVFDPVCGPLFELAFRSQSWRGRHLVVGFAGGPIPALPVNLPLMKGASLVGVDVRQFMLFEAELAEKHLSQLLAWVDEGRLDPPVGRRFPMTSFADAMEFAISGKGVGKVIIDVNVE